MLKGKVLAAASRANATPPAPTVVGINVDSSSAFYTRSTDFTGIVDASTGIISVWLRTDTIASAEFPLFFCGGAIQLQINNGSFAGQILVVLQSPVGTEFSFRSTLATGLTMGSNYGWVHVLVSWNTNFSAGNKLGQIYLNGYDAGFTRVSDTAGAFVVDYTNSPSTIGYASSYVGGVSELYFAAGQYLDFTVQANVDKFISSTGYPVDLGTSGQIPTGTSPTVYLRNSTVSTWGNNLGTGGNFTQNGTPTLSANNPSTVYSGTLFYSGSTSAVSSYVYNPATTSTTFLYNPVLSQTAPGDTNFAVGVSKDGNRALLSSVGSGTTFVPLKRMGHIFVRTGAAVSIAGSPSNLGGISFSSDGSYVAISHSTSPNFSVYSRTGDTWTKLANPAVLPNGNGVGCAMTADGVYIAVTQNVGSAPNLLWYQRSGSTLTKLTDPTQPALSLLGCAWDPTGTYLAVGTNSSPFFHWYSRSGTTLTKLSNPTTLPTGNVRFMAWMNDTYVVAAVNSSPFLTFYKRTGTTLDALTAPSSMPTQAVIGIAASNDGNFVTAYYGGTSPFALIYYRSGDTFTALSNPTVLPGSSASYAAMS